MSVTIYGHHDGDAIFEDDNGPARIPGAEIARILTRN